MHTNPLSHTTHTHTYVHTLTPYPSRKYGQTKPTNEIADTTVAFDSKARIRWRFPLISCPPIHHHHRNHLRLLFCFVSVIGNFIVAIFFPVSSHILLIYSLHSFHPIRFPKLFSLDSLKLWLPFGKPLDIHVQFIGLGPFVCHPAPPSRFDCYSSERPVPEKKEIHFYQLESLNDFHVLQSILLAAYKICSICDLWLSFWFAFIGVVLVFGCYYYYCSCCSCYCRQINFVVSTLSNGTILKGIKFPLQPSQFHFSIRAMCTIAAIKHIINWEHATLTFRINQRSANAAPAIVTN